MAKKKGGLGKGLDAIFAENESEGEHTAVMLKLSELEPNRSQPRHQFNEQALSELADSISRYGVLQPLLVRPLLSGGYQIVAGERRWRAARMAGVDEVPAVVKDLTDEQVMELALIENLQREDLNPLEEAQGFQSLMDTYGMTQDEVAKTVGKSRPAVANALRLMNLPESIQKLVSAGTISAGHARALLLSRQKVNGRGGKGCCGWCVSTRNRKNGAESEHGTEGAAPKTKEQVLRGDRACLEGTPWKKS